MVQFVVGRHDRGTLQQWLTHEGLARPCADAELWLRDLSPTTSVMDVVERCPEGSWLLWAASRLGIDQETLQPVRDAMIRRGVGEYLFAMIEDAGILSAETDPREWLVSMDPASLRVLSRDVYAAATKQRERLELKSRRTETERRQAWAAQWAARGGLDLGRVLSAEPYAVALTITAWVSVAAGMLQPARDSVEALRAESAQIADETRELLRHHPVWVNAIRDFGVIGTGYCDE